MSDSCVGIVHLIDDEEPIRDSLTLLLKSVGIECRSYPDALQFLQSFTNDPDCCLVVDIRMPGMSGLELQAEVNRRGISNPVIFITGHGEIEMAVRAMRDGAFDFLQKPLHDQLFLDSVNAALRHARSTTSATRHRAKYEQCLQTLSPREREVMQLVAAGKANKVIALDLDVSQRTVEIHRARVMEKMGARSLAELVRISIVLESSAQ